MSYQITFDVEPGYIHAKVTGINSRETAKRYLDDIRQACVERDCFHVLVEECLEGPRLGAMEVFSIVSEGSIKSLGQFEAIACVDQKMGETSEFAETIAVNRGMPVTVFNNTDDAREWLLK